MSPQQTDIARDLELCEIIDEFLEMQNNGTPVSLGEWKAKYPEFAGDLDECLECALLFHPSSASIPATEHRPLEDEKDFRWLSDGSSGLQGHLQSAAQLQLPRLRDFEILGVAGQGGMGVVYEALQISLSRRVALKVIPVSNQTSLAQRFKIEAHAAAQLQHPNIVQVYETGVSNGYHFHSMQFVEGCTLASILQQLREANWRPGRDFPVTASKTNLFAHLANRESLRQQTGDLTDPVVATANEKEARDGGDWSLRKIDEPVAENELTQRNSPAQVDTGHHQSTQIVSPRRYYQSACQLVLKAVQALQHAHENGVIHRDIKPSNLLVDHKGSIWVTDFGLALLHNEHQLTQTGDIVGTIRYMSPEQASGRKEIDVRTDIYSLAATLYELVCLQPVVIGEDRGGLLASVLTDKRRSPREHVSSIPVELETIIMKGLAFDVEDRYQTTNDLADDLQRFLDDRPILARTPTIIERLQKFTRRHRKLVGIVASITMLAAILVAVISFRAANALEVAMKKAQDSDASNKSILREISLAHSEAARLDQRPGHQQRALRSAQQAAEIKPDLAARNAAIAALALPTLKLEKTLTCSMPHFDPNVKFSQDLKTFVEESPKGSILVRNTADGTRIASLDTKRTRVEWLTMSENGKTVATTSSFGARHGPFDLHVWDVASRTLLLHVKSVHGHALHVSPDGELVGYAVGNSVIVQDLADKSNRREVEVVYEPRTIRFDRFTNRIAVAGRGNTEEQLSDRRVQPPQEEATRPDANATTTSESNEDLGLKTRPIQTPNSYPGKPAGYGRFDLLEVFDTELNRITSIQQPDSVSAISFHPNRKRIAVLALPFMCHIWDIDSGVKIRTLRDRSFTSQFEISPSGLEMASFGSGSRSRLWNLETTQSELRFKGRFIRFDSTGKRIVGCDGTTIRIYGRTHSPFFRKRRGPIRRSVTSTTFLGESRVIATACNSGIDLWDAATMQHLKRLSSVESYEVRYNTKTNRLFGADRKGILSWRISQKQTPGSFDIRIGQPKRLPIPAHSWCNDLEVTDEGTGFLVDARQLVAFSNTRSKKTLTLHKGFSPDGLAVSSDAKFGAAVFCRSYGEAYVWSLETGQVVRQFSEVGAEAAFIPHSKFFCLASVDGYHIYDIETWQKVRVIPREGADFNGAVTCSRNGEVLALATSRSVVRLYSTRNWEEFAALEVTPTPTNIWCLAISDDLSRIAVGYMPVALGVWQLNDLRHELKPMKLDWQNYNALEPRPATSVSLEMGN